MSLEAILISLVLLLCIGTADACYPIEVPVQYETAEQCLTQSHIIAGVYRARLRLPHNYEYQVSCRTKNQQNALLATSPLYSELSPDLR